MKVKSELSNLYYQTSEHIKDRKPEKSDHIAPLFPSVSERISRTDKIKQSVLRFFKHINNYLSVKFRNPSEVKRKFLKDFKSFIKASENSFNKLNVDKSMTIRLELPKNIYGYTEDFVIKLTKTKNGVQLSTILKTKGTKDSIEMSFDSYKQFAREFGVRLKPEQIKTINPNVVESKMSVEANSYIDNRTQIRKKLQVIINSLNTKNKHNILNSENKHSLQTDVQKLISELTALNPELQTHVNSMKQYEKLELTLESFIDTSSSNTIIQSKNPKQLQSDFILFQELYTTYAKLS